MCVTSEIAGTVALKGASKRETLCRELGAAHGGGNQFLPGQRRGVTHVSRLQCVQSAIEQQILQVYRENPEKRIGLITFNNDVTIIGDGTQDEVVVSGDKLSSLEQLQAVGDGYLLQTPVATSKDALLRKLWDLEESGPTALGPALLLGIVIAGAQPGSSVILATDGLANVGLGSLEDSRESAMYYTELAEQAKLRGVTVTVISLIGTECALESLSIVCEQTAGSVQRVDPVQLASSSLSLVDRPIVAFGVMAMVLLHRGLQFRVCCWVLSHTPHTHTHSLSLSVSLSLSLVYVSYFSHVLVLMTGRNG
jgi:hypothetical protein